MKGLYYFTNDQRLSDNFLLQEATKDCDEILFVAKAPSSLWGIYRQKFHWESLQCLDRQLKLFNQSLTILEEPLQEIPLDKFDKVYVAKWNTPYEKKEFACIPENKMVTHFQDRLLEDLSLSVPDIFTEFRKKIEKIYICPKEISPIIDFPNQIDLDEKSSLKAPPFKGPHVLSSFPFSGGEKAALERLNCYTFKKEHITSYKETRNGLIGTEYSTKLSPYLAIGNLSPRTIYRTVEKFEREVKKSQDTYWVKFELWWREYFRWVFEKYPHRFFSPLGIKKRDLSLKEDPSVFQKWREGETQNQFINAFMRELKETGYMSNRGRQIVASYLVNDLKQPWWWGADYFEKLLVDYDVYSNWGNWQYIAGVGNDPRPNRYFNPQKQADVYDPSKEFQNLWASPSD